MVLTERRRLSKNNKSEYRKLNKTMRTEVRSAKERWIGEKCEEMENLQKKHNSYEMHNKVKGMASILK